MAADTELQFLGGGNSEPTPGVAITSTACILDREDSLAGNTPIPEPMTTGTHFSWFKPICLATTSTDTTLIKNRTIKIAASPALPTGVLLWFKAVDTYVEAQASDPPDGMTDGATPATYGALTTTPTLYDAAGQDTTVTGRNGKIIQIVIGIDSTCTLTDPTLLDLPIPTINYEEQ